MHPQTRIEREEEIRAPLVAHLLRERQVVLAGALMQFEHESASLADAAGLLVRALQRGGKVLSAGNGGSAAEAQHFAAELVGRFQQDRRPYPAVALTTDTSVLTAVANDYGYEQVFARQIVALAQPGDVFFAFSTSGESENLVRAAAAARQCGIDVVAVTGQRASRLTRLSNVAVLVPVPDTPTAQEIHMMVTHILCGIAERTLELGEGGR